LDADTGEESKIHFVFYTSALSPRNFDTESFKRQILNEFSNSDSIEVSIFFATDINKEIAAAEAIKPVVERGKIQIDKKGNFLLYGDNAAIVNVSVFSIKQLYATHNISLLAQKQKKIFSAWKLPKPQIHKNRLSLQI